MRVSFIGMSNIGKSFWAKRMVAERGFTRIDCDALIERKLAPELAPGGHRGLRGIAKWLGFPSEATYEGRRQLYQRQEQVVVVEAIERLDEDKTTPFVIDTTGSVIYIGSDILADLRRKTCIVYFEGSETHITDLFKRYISTPKPVIWDTYFVPQGNETLKETLKRCYPDLLEARAKKYRELAHITIPYSLHHDRTFDIGAFLEKESARR